jgi:cytochrome c-type biogenesis protein CcmH
MSGTRASQHRGPDARWRQHLAAVAAGLLLAAASAQVQAPAAPATDPALDARVKALASELRCLVCQNQTVEDSTAPVARDMREQVRMQLAAGKSEAEVKQYMTDRFGDFVLYKPPVKATTIALWAGPFVALIFAGLLLVRRVRRSSANPQPAALSDADRARALALLDQPMPATPARGAKDTTAV